MAVTDTTALTELVNSEFINPAILDYAHDFAVAAPFVNLLDLRGKSTKVGSFPRWILDTATDITNETTTLGNELLESTDVQITAAEIGIRRDVTDAALEETILSREQLFDFLVRDAGTLFGISLDDDICALFAALNGGTAVGTTKTNLSLANMVEAQATIRKNGMRGPLVYVLDDQQALDYQSAQAAATSTTVDAFFQVATGIDDGYLGTFMGAPVWQTGLCDTANTAEDVVGACFIDGAASKTHSAIGMVLTREVRSELERDANERLTEFVATAKWGVGEVHDKGGVPIVTDA
jgi:hypothetical protein